MGGLGCTTGAGTEFKPGVVEPKLGRLCSCGGAPTKPARLVKESRAAGAADGNDQAGEGDAVAGRGAVPNAGKPGE